MPASTSLIRLHAALTDAATEPDSLPEIIVVRGIDWPEWLSWLVFAGLIGALIIEARRPHQPESSLLARQGFRTLLAAAAGWLAAAIVIAAEEWLFPIPSPTGVAVSGLIFGASVMAPVLDEPSKHPLRYLLLLLAGMATQLVLWGIGVGSFEWLSERDGVSPAFAAIQFVPGVISVMACYFIMTIALWRIASLIPTVRLGTGLFLLGCICGVFLTIAVLGCLAVLFRTRPQLIARGFRSTGRLRRLVCPDKCLPESGKSAATQAFRHW